MKKTSQVVYLLSALCAVCFFLQPVAALYSRDSDVTLLTSDNFDRAVWETNELPSFVEFFAPWCGHCRNFAPEYERSARTLKGLVNVYAVDCDENGNRPLCSRFKIQGFPTIKLFSSNTGSEGTEYQGPRSISGLSRFATEHIPSHVTRMTSHNVDDFFANTTMPRVLLFTQKSTTPPLFRALSTHLRGKMYFAEVRETDKAIMERFSIKSFPSIVVYPAQSKSDQERKGFAPSEGVPYNGGLRFDELHAFLNQYVKNETSSSMPLSSGSSPTHSIVQITSQQEFTQWCLDKSTGFCALFFSTTHSRDKQSQHHPIHLRMLQSLSTQFNHRIQFAWMDAVHQQHLLEYFKFSTNLPSLVLIYPHKHVYIPFTGAWEESEVKEFIDNALLGQGQKFRYEEIPRLVMQ